MGPPAVFPKSRWEVEAGGCPVCPLFSRITSARMGGSRGPRREELLWVEDRAGKNPSTQPLPTFYRKCTGSWSDRPGFQSCHLSHVTCPRFLSLSFLVFKMGPTRLLFRLKAGMLTEGRPQQPSLWTGAGPHILPMLTLRKPLPSLGWGGGLGRQESLPLKDKGLENKQGASSSLSVFPGHCPLGTTLHPGTLLASILRPPTFTT